MSTDSILSTHQYRAVQLLANLVFVLVWFFANEGLLFWDDFTYLNFANQVNQGGFEITTNHFTSRIALIYPTSLGINWLGINQFSMVLFPLLCALGILNLFFLIGREFGQMIGLIAGFLMICDYHLIYFSTHLFPEVPLAFCAFVFFLSYYLLLQERINAVFAGSVGAVFLFAAFLMKTTVFLIVPFLIFLFLMDIKQRRHRKYWLAFIGVGVLLLAANGLWYQMEKGSFFYRFENIADNHVASAKTFFDKNEISLLKRLTYLPLVGFLRGAFFVPIVIALPALMLLRKNSFRLQSPREFWPVSMLILLLSYWFFSTNWRYYSPLPTENRHIVFFIPVFIMTAATYWPQARLFEFLKEKKLLLLIVLSLLIIPAFSIYKSSDTGFKATQELVKKHFVENGKSDLVITDGLLSYGYSYFYPQLKSEDEFVWFSDETLEARLATDQPVYLLVNRAYFNAEYEDDEKYRSFIDRLQNTNRNLGLIEQIDDVRLYLIGKNGNP